MWFGFCDVDVPPSPKFQLQLVIEPVELSVNATFRGASPLVGVAEKPATQRAAASELLGRVSELESRGLRTAQTIVSNLDNGNVCIACSLVADSG